MTGTSRSGATGQACGMARPESRRWCGMVIKVGSVWRRNWPGPGGNKHEASMICARRLAELVT